MNELRWCRRGNPTTAETRELDTSQALKITIFIIIIITWVPVFLLNVIVPHATLYSAGGKKKSRLRLHYINYVF